MCLRGAARVRVVAATDLSVLLQSVAAGDRRAFRDLYDATSPKLLGIAVRILRDKALAEEILQDVYLRVWRNANRYSPEAGAPMTWLSTIARNRAIDVVRSRKAEPIAAAPAGDEDGGWLESLADPAGEGVDRVDAQALQQCLGQVEGELRHCLVLAYCEGYSREELADRFGRNVNTIKTWLRRGLAALRVCLDPPCP